MIVHKSDSGKPSVTGASAGSFRHSDFVGLLRQPPAGSAFYLKPLSFVFRNICRGLIEYCNCRFRISGLDLESHVADGV